MAQKTYRFPRIGGYLLAGLRYRRPMRVSEIMEISDTRGKTSWAICPRCGITMNREFMIFCDHCGQRLDWSMYEQAKVVYPRARK